MNAAQINASIDLQQARDRNLGYVGRQYEGIHTVAVITTVPSLPYEHCDWVHHRADMVREHVEWMRQQGWVPHHDYNFTFMRAPDPVVSYMFADRNHAMLFKLTWVGV